MTIKKDDNMKNNFKEGIKISFISIILNIILSVFKFIAGILGKSNVMISDSIHSLSDVLSNVIVIIGLKISNKKEDFKHPYGHERIECIVTFILSIFLFITGITIGYIGFKTILIGNYSSIKTPSTIALVAAIISIILKESMYWYTKKIAKKINSNSLMADAWHHRSDSLSSIGSLIGISGAMIGFKVLEPIASIIIGIFILKVAIDIFIDSINKTIDKSCSDEFIKAITDLVQDIKGVESIDSIKTRLFGNKIYIDIEIGANEKLTLKAAHNIAQEVHDKIENTFIDVKHCMVHMNPIE